MKHIGLLLGMALIAMKASAIKITSLSEINGNELLITEIDLSNRGIVEFPEIILQCKNLETLSLRKNGFVELPLELGKLEHLKKLDLSENQNISPLQLNDLFDSCVFELEELYLEDCALFFLPEGIAKQESIAVLDISDNYIQTLPYAMMHMNRLENADFSNNKLRDISWLSTKWWALKEIDASGNEDLEAAGLLMNLSFQDNIEKITVSNLSVIPQEFKYFTGKEIVFKNCVIPDLPRHKYSSKIARISFENCVFPKPEKIVERINSYAKPGKLTFRNTEHHQLLPFLNANVDSLDLRDNQLTLIDPVIEMEKLKWLDIRSNPVSNKSLDFVSNERPDITLFASEPIQESVGISPPFPGREPQPEVVKIQAKKPQVVPIGKTIFNIPENAFLTQSGEVYQGPVDIEYTEYNTPEDIFLSGISMTTNFEGEPYMLSSGGMFRFEAKDQDGNELQANPSQPIQAKVISQSSRPNMQTWRMNDTGVWVDYGEDNMDEVFKLDKSRLDSIMKIDFGSLIETNVEYVHNRYVPIIKKGDRLKDFEISFELLNTDWRTNKKIRLTSENDIEVFTRDYHSEFLCHTNLVYDGDSSAYYQEKLEAMHDYCSKTYSKLRLKQSRYESYTKQGPNFITELKLSPDYENDNFDLTFKFKDSVVNIPVVFKTRSDHYSSKPKEISSYFNRYQYSFKKYVKEKRRNYFKIVPYIKKAKKAMRLRALNAEKARQRNLFDQRGNNKLMLSIGSVERSVSMDGFGLWNCDVRSRMVAPRNMGDEFYSVAGEMIDDKVEKVTVIDKSQNGVVNFDGKEKKFFDKNSKNVIIVFFASVGVGIFKSWIDNIRGNKLELRLLDPTSAEKEIESLIKEDS